jgi:hypothetical protein
MAVIFFLIFLWFFLIIIYALTHDYYHLLPKEKVEQGWLTWNENFKHQHQKLCLTHPDAETRLDRYEYLNYRIDIQLKGLFRWLFNKPVKFDKLITKAKDSLTDAEQRDPSKFHTLKKNGKIRL